MLSTLAFLSLNLPSSSSSTTSREYEVDEDDLTWVANYKNMSLLKQIPLKFQL